MHKQKDDLTFSWFDNGSPIITDSGKYSYNSDSKTAFYRSRFAHNTITIDDESPFLYRPSPYGSGIKGSGLVGKIYWTQGEVYRDDYNVNHQRALVLNPNQWLLVLDKLEAEDVHSYQQIFHLAPEYSASYMDRQMNKAISPITATNKKNKLFIRNVSNGKAMSTLTHGKLEPHIQGWISETYLKDEPRTTIVFKSKAQNLTIATLFSFNSLYTISHSKIHFTESTESINICWRDSSQFTNVLFNGSLTPTITSASCVIP